MMVGTKVVIEIREPEALTQALRAAETIAAWVRATTGVVYDTKVNIYSLFDEEHQVIEPEDIVNDGLG